MVPAGPMIDGNILTPGHPGVKVKNVDGISGTTCLCLLFLFPERSEMSAQCHLRDGTREVPDNPAENPSRTGVAENPCKTASKRHLKETGGMLFREYCFETEYR